MEQILSLLEMIGKFNLDSSVHRLHERIFRTIFQFTPTGDGIINYNMDRRIDYRNGNVAENLVSTKFRNLPVFFEITLKICLPTSWLRMVSKISQRYFEIFRKVLILLLKLCVYNMRIFLEE